MSALIWAIAMVALLVYVNWVHAYYRRQKRICATYPYYRLRDQVVWDIIQSREQTPEQENLYGLLNRIVHHTDKFGWGFISAVVQEVTHAVLQERRSKEAPAPMEVALVDLVVESAKSNSWVVRLALTRAGRVILLYPIVKACYEHARRKHPARDSALRRRVETVRRVRRLNMWRQAAAAAAA